MKSEILIYGLKQGETRDYMDDIIERIEELESLKDDHEAEPDAQELQTLTDIMDDLKGYGGDEQWRGDCMNRHSLTYIDLHPEPVDTREPSPLMIWAGAALALGALYLLTVFLFSL